MKNISNTVLKNDMCIGCGLCKYVAPDSYGMHFDDRGFLQAYVKKKKPSCSTDHGTNPELVCPFSSATKNEDELADLIFEKDILKDKYIGKYIKCYAGKVLNTDTYQQSSSGGIGRWLLAKLLALDLVDYVVTIFDTPALKPGDPLYSYKITSDINDIRMVSKSAYYPIELSQVLEEIRNKPGRYVVTGLPCFVKAIRNLCLHDGDLKKKIIFTVGIVCGHLKSKYYAELLGWQLGIEPNNLRSLDFRKKLPGKLANEKGVSASKISSPLEYVEPKTVKDMFGTDYGFGLFKYPACDMCDDVVAECSDISIGDAWLPQYVHEGTSIVVIRNRQLSVLFDKARLDKEVQLDILSPEDVYNSQASGFRHRKEGLAYRIDIREKKGLWTPPKRISLTEYEVSQKYRSIFDLRSKIIYESPSFFRKAIRKNNLGHFEAIIRKKQSRYYAEYTKKEKVPTFLKVKSFLRSILYFIGLKKRHIQRLKACLRF